MISDRGLQEAYDNLLYLKIQKEDIEKVYEDFNFEEKSDKFISEVSNIVSELPEYYKNDILKILDSLPFKTFKEGHQLNELVCEEFISEMNKILYILSDYVNVWDLFDRNIENIKSILYYAKELINTCENIEIKDEMVKILKPDEYYISLFQNYTEEYDKKVEYMKKTIIILLGKIKIILGIKNKENN